MNYKKVVIAGGGFGGLETAIKLRQLDSKIHITVVDKSDKFVFLPSLFEFISGKRNENEITLDLKAKLEKKGIIFIQDTIIGLDKEKNELITKKGKLEFDALLISLGGEPWHFNIPGAKENSISLYSLESAKDLKNKIQEISTAKHNKAKVVVCGGGFNGVETAGELNYYCTTENPDSNVQICICEAAPQLLPNFPKSAVEKIDIHLRKKKVDLQLNSSVKKIENNTVYTSGKNIEADLVVWSAGARPNKTILKIGIETTNVGIKVNKFLQTSEKNIFAIGDCADLRQIKLDLQKTAQTAMHEGKHAAKNILNLLNKKELTEFKPKNRYTQAATLGEIGLVIHGTHSHKGKISQVMKDFVEKKYFFTH